MEILASISPWTASAQALLPGLELFDAHTHLGEHDPDGMRQSAPELLEVLKLPPARGGFVFPFHEPDGYRQANDMVIAAAAESEGRLVPFCRVDPNDDAVAEARRALDAGARGIKLHPRAEQFPLDHPQVRELFLIAHERELPILIHAGRGIPALGEHAVELAGEFPAARVILAHAGITDLSWIWRTAADLPNLLFDSSWWMGADLLALFSLVPPGQIVFASDMPYGHTIVSGVGQVRLMLQAGLSVDQIHSITSGQSLRIAAGEPLQTAGPAIGEPERAGRVLLERVVEFLQLGTLMSMRGIELGPELLALARLACVVPDGVDDAPVFAAILKLLEQFDEATAEDPENRRRLSFLMMAMTVARTPDVPLPAGFV
jgi:predicted TIM-barrel fold metal-dependent hydrolase